MARVVDQKSTDRITVSGFDIRKIAVMIFDVSCAFERIRIVTAFKFTENILIRFSQNMRLHIESSPVRHPEYDLPNALLCCLFQHSVHHGNKGIGAFKGKTRLTQVFFMQKLFEKRCLIEFFKYSDFGLLLQIGTISIRFHTILQPLSLGRVLKVHIFNTHGMAVCLFECPYDLTHGCRINVGKPFDKDRFVQIFFRESECGQV